MPHALNGLRVVSFESRRSAEMAELIRNYGGEPIQAPSMREVSLTDQREALAFGETLLAGDWDALILLTGIGTRMLIATLATRWPKDEVVKALGRLTLVCRGPKPIAALKEVGLAPALAVPEPNTWRDLLSELDLKLPVAGKRVAVQEYGARNEDLLAGLRQRSAHQADNLFRVAAEMGRADALRDALRGRTVVVSIGPITTEALQGHGIQPDLHPEHPKMGHLLIAVAREADNLLRRKRGG